MTTETNPSLRTPRNFAWLAISSTAYTAPYWMRPEIAKTGSTIWPKGYSGHGHAVENGFQPILNHGNTSRIAPTSGSTRSVCWDGSGDGSMPRTSEGSSRASTIERHCLSHRARASSARTPTRRTQTIDARRQCRGLRIGRTRNGYRPDRPL